MPRVGTALKKIANASLSMFCKGKNETTNAFKNAEQYVKALYNIRRRKVCKCAGMKTIKVPFGGKGYKVTYSVETIDLSMTPIQFINVYSVFIDDPELQKIIGSHFTMVHNSLHIVKPAYDIKSSANVDEVNLKKTIAQQILNNPTE